MLAASYPRIVGAEVPDVALRVAAGIAPAAIVLVLDLEEDLGAGFLGAGVVQVGVGDDDIGALRADTALRRPDQATERVVARRAKHDHAVAEDELGMGYGAVLARHDEMPLEARRRGTASRWRPAHRDSAASE